MVHLGTRKDISVLFLVFCFSAYFSDVESACTIDCVGSGGNIVGAACSFEVEEELQIGEVAIQLEFQVNDCDQFQLNSEANELFNIDGTNITMKKVFDYDVRDLVDPRIKLELSCEDDICGYEPGSSGRVKFININDNDINLSESKGTASVFELIKYNSGQEVKVTPPINATDADVESSLLYSIDDNEGYFTLEDGNGNVACFATYITEGLQSELNTAAIPVLTIKDDRSFDYGVTSSFNLTVVIQSFLGDESCLGEAVANETYALTVYVEDLDDQPPIFNETVYSCTVEENSLTFTYPPNVYAFDQDKGLNEPISYSLQPQEGEWDCSTYVEIDASSGDITILETFDFEDNQFCQLILRAEQINNPLRSSTAELNITILDVNDNCPQINATSLQGSYIEGDNFVSDETLQDWLLLTVTDADSSLEYNISADSTYFRLESACSNDECFRILPTETNYENLESENITITVTDPSCVCTQEPCNRTDTVIIEIIVPEESTILNPTFEQPEYSATIDENETGYLLQVTALNGDNTDEMIEYSLPDPEDVFFTINETGHIHVLVGLDYETMSKYFVTVKATDTRWTDVERSSTVVVNVTVNDLNDNPPVLEGFPLFLYVSESTPPGTVIGTLQAVDRDAGSTLIYQFEETPTDFTFTLNNDTGEISTSSTLDADDESKRQYNATVTVFDGENTSPSEKVVITVLDVNDNPPIMRSDSQFLLNINENDAGPQKLVVTVTDNDYLEVNKKYELSSDGGLNVTINQETGEVNVTGPFDREVNNEFQFTLTVNNTAPPFWETSENVVVSILDENDEEPVFTEETQLYCGQLTVTEEEIPEQPLCSYTATDRDEIGSENSRITYTVDSEEYADYFNIDGSTGELSLEQPLDRETDQNITITIVATDNGQPRKSVSMAVTVIIEGVNDNRPFFNGTYTTTVHEETIPNTLITIVAADDIDVPFKDPIYYKPVNEADRVWETFYLRSENGECEIYLKSALDVTESPYNLEIATYDGDSNPSYEEGPNNNTVVEIVVQPRETCNISMDTEYRTTISEIDLSDDETVVDVNASSSCSSSEDGIHYIITQQLLQPVEGSDTESTFFVVNEENGQIYTEDVTDVDIGMYVLTITAYNGTGSELDQSEASTKVYINVTDVNNKCPYFEETEYFARYTAEDPYLSSANVPLWLVVIAMDDDTEFTGEVAFSDNITFTEFIIESSSERSFLIAVNDILPSNMTLNITVSDDTLDFCESSLTTVFISVEDYLSPVFLNESYETSLSENPEVGYKVIEVTAENADGTTGNITYAIKSPLNTPFMINTVTGEITVAFGGIDYEAVKSYDLTVSATDNRWDVARSSDTQVLITIDDVNEFPPEFLGLPDAISVQEGIEIYSEVFLLKAIDGDTDDNEILTYKLIDGYGKFSVNNLSGIVFTIDTIDFEIDPPEYILNVSVSDEENESFSELRIELLNVNDNAPVFSQGVFDENITENQAPFYIDVRATDDDINETLSYNLSGSYPLDTLVNETGFVIFNKKFDREEQDAYSFFVIATDGKFETSAVINVLVLDENDNFPQFISICDGRVNLEEDVEVGTSVCVLAAEDADAPGINSIITYRLLNADELPFDIDTSSGNIFLTERLNYETSKSYVLTVQASDGMDGSGNTVNGSLEVFVLDVNDNPPTFDDTHPSIITVVFDLAVGSQVTKLLVSDDDDPPFDAFLCEKTEANDASWDTFYLTTMRDGCSIILGATLNSSIDYTLRVTAVDTANSSLMDFTQFEVVVRDTYPCEITLDVEDVTLNKTEVTGGVIVADVQAVSNCSDSENGIMFTLLSQQFRSPLGDVEEFSEEFNITETDGTIFYDGSAEYASVGDHELVVEAVNASDSAVRTSIQFVITIEDVDVSEPEFPDPPQIPDNPDPSSTSVFVGRFDEGDEYVYSYDDTAKLTITADDNDTCFAGSVEILKPSSTPFYLEVQSSGNCVKSYQAYLRVNGTWQNIENVTTFQIVLLDGSSTEVGTGNVTVEKLPLSPVFQESSMITVMENANVGDNVTMVRALNNDGAEDGIEYQITSQTEYFDIDPKSGIITVKSVGIDYESTKVYSLSLSAQDTRWNPLRTTDTVVNVDVTDVNEFDPVISPFPRISIQENVALAGTTIYKIQAFDSDGSSSLEYGIVNNTDTFNVSSDSGDVMLVSSIDAETDPLTYYVNVSVTDGTNVVSDVLFVEVIDFNEFPPNITGDSEVEMYENDTSVTVQITAVDPDISHLPILYSIEPSDSIASIDDTGLITFRGTLDYADGSSYMFTVTAEEESSERFSSLFEVTLIVLDINDHDPELLAEDCPQEVLEGPDSVTTVICTLSATDEDAESETTFTYLLLNSFGGTFELDPESGELIVAIQLNRESQEDYTLEVLVNDGGNPSRNSTITEIYLKVGDINDNAPKFVSPPSMPINVEKDSAAGTTVAELTVVDEDAFPNNISRCERTFPMDLVWNNFTISNDRVGYCEIITRAVLSYPSSYTLDISAVDLNQEDLSTDMSVSIVVTLDATCPLSILVQSPVTFDEDQLGPGSEVTTVNVSSPCTESLDDITLGITDQSLLDPDGNEEDVNVFEIDESGLISVNSSASISVGVYTVTVTAYNTSNPMSTATTELTIVVNDINNNCPAFVMDSDEGIFAEGDTFIYDVESTDRLVIVAEDPDLDFIGDLSVKSSNIAVVEVETVGNVRLSQLSIVSPFTGNITVQITLDDRSITCKADVIDIHIYEIPVLELLPIFLNPESFNGTVWENATAGTNVTQVKAEDKNGDSSGIKYSFEEEDSHFSIDPASGVITTTDRGLDYETRNTFILRVLASDEKWDPPRTSEINVTIQVLDIDEYPLELAEIPPLTVAENTPTDTLIYTAWATDADGSSSFTFSLEDSMNKFAIDPNSGEIYTSSGLDAETSDYFNITVTVTEESSTLSDSQVVNITISDVNDFHPVFNQSEYSEEVSENFEGIQWFTVYATDGDLTSANNEISYSLNDEADSRFSVDSEVGNITINTETNPFDREVQGSYQFFVIASDNGNPALSTSARVSVTVTDTNDNPPIFSDPVPESVTIKEGETGTIGTFKATDDDDDMNGIITYSVSPVDSRSEGLFEISNEGVLSVIQKLDREDMASHTLKIYATDSGSPSLNTSIEVTVVVLDINDNPPVFQGPFSTVIEASLPVGSEILQISATDDDESPNDVIIFTPDNSSSSVWTTFTLQSNDDGTSIILISQLDFEFTQTYKLDVKASNLDGAQVVTQEYTVVASDGTVCFVIVEVPSDGTEKIKQTDLKQNETFLQLNATSSNGCDEDVFEFFLKSQVYRAFADSDKEFVDDTTFRLSPNGELSPIEEPVATGEYQLVVTAVNKTDRNEQLSIGESLITIEVVSDTNTAPIFDEEYSRNIRLPKEVGEFLFQLSATDSDTVDSGNNLLVFEKLSESNGDTETSYFKVEENGRVFASSNLLTNDIVDLTVQVTDSGIPPLSDNTTIQVKLTMDAAPTLESGCDTTVTIDENAAVGTTVCRVISKGEEEVSFTLISGNPEFVIDANGTITTNVSLNYEIAQDYQITVNAEGIDTKLNSTIQILVKVADINEYPPVLENDYFFSLLEDSGNISNINCPELEFGVISATDDDGSEENSFTTYSLEGDSRFVIDNATGVISKTGCIDVDDTPGNQEISLILRAVNSKADPMLDDTAVVNITITDVNDKTPELILNGDQDIVRQEFIENEELFDFEFSDDDISAGNRESVYSFEPSMEDILVFDIEEGKISTGTTQPPPATDIAVLVTITNKAEPRLSDSLTVLYRYNEGSYFPEELTTQSVSVEENNDGIVQTDVLGPIGSLPGTKYSVFDSDGRCSEYFTAEYKSDTYLQLSSKVPLDFEEPDNREFNVTIVFASNDDDCATARRKKRQANVLAVSDSSSVTINVVNVNDEPPSFSGFSLGNEFPRYYQAIHVSRVVDEVVYDISQDGGKVTDADGMPDTLTYVETDVGTDGENKLVKISSDGSVAVKKLLTTNDANNVTVDVNIQVQDSEEGSTDDAVLRLRVMEDSDLFFLWFNWTQEEDDLMLLQCVQECFPVDTYVFSERVVKSENSISVLWLYAVLSKDHEEDFITRAKFIETWDDYNCTNCSSTVERIEERQWSNIQIAVFILAVLILVGAIIFILVLFYSYKVYEQEKERHRDLHKVPPSTESEDSFRPVLAPLARGESIFDKIAREKNTTLYGSDVAILDLLSEADDLSIDGKLVLEVNALPEGDLVLVEPLGQAEKNEEQSDDGEDDLLDPYSTFAFDPAKKDEPVLGESAPVLVHEATDNSETSMLDDILAEYDNKAFEDDEPPKDGGSPPREEVEHDEPSSKVNIQHGGGETSTDTPISAALDGEMKTGDGSTGRESSGAALTPSAKNASDQEPKMDDSKVGYTDANVSDDNNGSQEQRGAVDNGGAVDGRAGNSEGAIPVTTL